MCLYKNQTYVSKYCSFQLNADVEKNPGTTPLYIDLSKTKTAPYRQAIWTKLRTIMCCNEFMLFDLQLQTRNQSFANDLELIMNIGTQLFSRLSQLTRRSFLMFT